jgi:tetratricopeptide (TPR) repeat protein
MRLTRAIERRILLTTAVLLASPAFGAAQPIAGCTTPGCTPAAGQVQAATVRIAQLKQEFAAALRQFITALTGFSSDREAVQLHIESLDRALIRWDEAIRTFETRFTQAREIDVRVALGTIYLERHRLDDALRELGEVVRRDPRRADVHAIMAMAYRLAGKSSEALQALQTASDLEPDNPTTLYELARHRMTMGQSREAQTARALFREAVKKRLIWPPLDARAPGPFEQISPLLPLAGTAPIFPPAVYAAGLASMTRGAYSEAIAQLRQAVTVDRLGSDSADASDHVRQGRAALRQGDLPSALKHLESAVESAPGSQARRILGEAYWADEQRDRALEQFRAAIRTEPNDERSWMALADLLATMGQFSEAEQVLKRAVQAFPASGQAHFDLGRLYQALGRTSDALGELEQAAQLKPLVGQDPLYEMIGEISIAVAAFDQAAKAVAARIDVNPNSAQAHRRLGDARLRQDRDEEALMEFLAALVIDPRDAAAYVAAAQVHLRAGRYAEAAEASERALALDRTLNEARYARGTALMRLGQIEEGASHLEEFRRLESEAAVAARRKYELERLTRDAAVSLANADYARAAGLLRQVLSYESAASTHLALGFALMAAGRPAEAIIDLNRALELKAGPDVHRYLAEAYAALGRIEESRSEAEIYRQMLQRLKQERLRKLSGSP